MNAPDRPPATARLRPAQRAASARSSIVREILKVALRPDVISLAGGLPAPESFPVEALRAAFDAELAQDGPARQALQYSTTEGHLPLQQGPGAGQLSQVAPSGRGARRCRRYSVRADQGSAGKLGSGLCFRLAPQPHQGTDSELIAQQQVRAS